LRIAVVRPQVPFVRGGAEITADRLVTELRERGHETDLVTVPFKWYPGVRVLTPAFPWRLPHPDEAGRRPDHPRRGRLTAPSTALRRRPHRPAAAGAAGRMTR